MNILITFFSLLTATIGRPILWIFSGFIVHGQDNLKKLNNRVIFIVNHTSRADEFIFAIGVPYRYLFKIFQCRFATHHHYYNNPLLKPVLKLLGGYPIYPKSGDLEYVLKGTMELSKNPKIKSFVIFPEGGIRRGKEKVPAKPGVAYLARETGWQIVPVKIDGAYRSTLLSFLLFKEKYMMHFGKPFNYEDVSVPDGDLRKIAEKMMDRVYEL